MAIASITKWLEDPNKSYNHGKALYEQYGDNRLLKTIINSGSSAYHFGKLLAGLQEVNKKSNLIPAPIVIGDYVAPAPDPARHQVDFATAPEKINQIRDEKAARYAQARKLHESIRFLDSADLRLQAALELLDHMDFVNDSWAIIDEWKETGKIHEIAKKQAEATVDELSLEDLIKESKNLPSYITKARKKLPGITKPAAQVKAAARLEQLINRFNAVKTRLAKEFEK